MSAVSHPAPPACDAKSASERAPARLRVMPAMRVAVISILVLIPCFWQSRIQAGDLSSHIYNAWLATMIQASPIHGLEITHQWTNILFDLILLSMLKVVETDAAQRIAVSAAVLIFFWGAFTLVSSANRSRPWFVMPFLATLTYGWVFHMGFFNFYLSTGLCLWAVAINWKPRFRGVITALPLLTLGFMAHALPVLWAVTLIAYLTALHRLAPRKRIIFTTLCLGSTVLARPAVNARVPLLFESSWSAERLARMTGADQAWVFGNHYIFVLAGLLGLYLFWSQYLIERRRLIRLVVGIRFQVWVLHAVGILLLPAAIFPPDYNAAFRFIPQRMTLVVGVATLVFLSTIEPPHWVKRCSLSLLSVFFCLLAFDTWRLNSVEDQVSTIVSQLPKHQRVIGPLCYKASRINALLHAVDRACVGNCFSLGNYEPSSLQFRIKATAPNPLVLHDQADIVSLETGTYKPMPMHLPAYLLAANASNTRLFLRALSTDGVATSACALTDIDTMAGKN
jgi:hypothetical protein